MINRLTVITIATTSLAACGSLPPVSVTYPFPKAVVDVTVTQTIGCYGNDPPALEAATTVGATATYSADRGIDSAGKEVAALGEINFANWKSHFSDEDIAVNFTDDGRLSGINASNTGQGTTILKNVASFASIVASVGAVAALTENRYFFVPREGESSIDAANRQNRERQAFNDAIEKRRRMSMSAEQRRATDICKIVNQYGKKAEKDAAHAAASGPATLTLTFESKIGFDTSKGEKQILVKNLDSNAEDERPGPQVNIQPTPDSRFLADQLFSTKKDPTKLATFTFSVGATGVLVTPPAYVGQPKARAEGQTCSDQDNAGLPSGTTGICVNRVAVASLSVNGPAGNLVNPPSSQLWSSELPIPLRSEPYLLVMPAAHLFGKQQGGVTISGYGSLTKLEYSANTEAADMTAAAGTIAKAAEGQTDAQQAAALQAKADLIYQQQRYVTCKLSTTACPSK